MKRIIPLLLLVAIAAATIHAAPPTPESVQHLAALAKVDKVRDAVLVQMDQSVDNYIKQALGGQAPTPADDAVAAACRAQIASTLDEEMSAPKIRAMYEKVYAETFTQEEIDGLIAFYSSPVGKVFAEKLPELNGKIGVMIQQGMGRVVPKLQMAVLTAAQKIRAAHAPKAIPRPPVPAKSPAPAYVQPGGANSTTPTGATPSSAATPKGN